ncbi:hypothetical protein IT570_08655 [Candidatus Sumerlaeota bacterium]|nr:hypothetical protein [Candidatus Sumerlaeota bacterium]
MLRSMVLGVLMAGCLEMAGAEVVDFSINQQTTVGQSVFLTGPFTVMGNSSIPKSAKLSPHNYPVWSIQMEIPQGVTFTPEFLLRNDSATAVADATNKTPIPGSTPVTTVPIPLTQTLTFIHEGAIAPSGVSILYTDPAGGVNSVPMTLAESSPGRFVYTSPISKQYFDRNGLYQFRVTNPDSSQTTVPSSGNARVNMLNTTWRFNQAFLHDEVPAQAPLAARTETFTFAPADFRSRTIRVLLPRDYDRNTGKTYPVLYAQDGQNVFSPGGPFGSWDLDLSIKSMIANGDLPEIILVGIDNSNDRFAEYTPEWGSVQGTQGRGREFLRAIRDELMPVIAQRYRVATGPENTSHVGSSLGGLLGLTASLEFEDVFGAVAAMSPSTQVNTAQILSDASQPPSSRSRLYMDCGTNSDGYNNTINVRDQLIESGHIYGPAFLFVVGPNMQHNEAAWRTRSPEMLRWMYLPKLTAPAGPGDTPTPSPTSSPTATATASATPSPTTTFTPTQTASVTPSATPTVIASVTPSPAAEGTNAFILSMVQ